MVKMEVHHILDHPLLQLVVAVVLLKIVIPLEVLVDLVVAEIGDLHQEVLVSQDKEILVVMVQAHLLQVVVAVEQVEQVVMDSHHQRLVVQVV
jgi:hypothetical protein